MKPPTAPPSRAERQRETREALIMAALVGFTRDGYHGASLEGIANEAGFSKGAVYSNFDGKAELFLAVMDHNLDALRGQDWDPFRALEAGNAGALDALAAGDDDAAELLRGFGLATLEFVAMAARDDRLMHELNTRMQVLIAAYERVAIAGRPDDDKLAVDEVAHLMAALDQGMSVLALTGVVCGDGTLMSTGLRRLLDPTNTTREPEPRGDRVSPFPDIEQIRQLLADAPGGPPTQDT